MIFAAKSKVDLDFLTVQLYNTISFEKNMHVILNTTCIPEVIIIILYDIKMSDREVRNAG